MFGGRGDGAVVDGGERHVGVGWSAAGPPAVLPERAPDPVGEAVGHAPHHPAEPPFFQLHHAHVVLQLLGRHVDVPRVPEHPPDQAEEDDDGPGVDEQVVDDQASENPDEHDEDPQDVVGHREPEGALAAADPFVPPLHDGLHLYGRRHGWRAAVVHWV